LDLAKFDVLSAALESTFPGILAELEETSVGKVETLRL
jgi:hypothetical protein